MSGHFEAVLAGDPRLERRPADVELLVDLVEAAHLDGSGTASPDQEATRREFLDLAQRGPVVLDRSPSTAHFTASALVVEHGARRFALLWHNKAQRWLQPGGHADGDGNLAHVAWREATEETGIPGLAVVVPAVHLDVHPFRPPGQPAHLHFDLRFVLLAPAGSTPVANHESAEVRWVEPGDLGALEPDPGLVHLCSWGLGVARSLPAVLWP